MKFKIGDKIKVCGDIITEIIEIIEDKYYFLDENGKRWYETEEAIEKY